MDREGGKLRGGGEGGDAGAQTSREGRLVLDSRGSAQLKPCVTESSLALKAGSRDGSHDLGTRLAFRLVEVDLLLNVACRQQLLTSFLYCILRRTIK